MNLETKLKTLLKSQDKKSRLIRTGLSVAALLVFNAIMSVPFAVTGQLADGTPIGLALRIVGFTVSAVWFVSVIAARFLKLEAVLRGFFFYGLLGIAFFAVTWVAKLAGGASAGYAVQIVFDWFSVGQRPLVYVLQPLIGMTEFFAKAIVFGIFTVEAGIAARSLVRQKIFEEKMAEREKFEQESKKST